jgi:hypothetical protein
MSFTFTFSCNTNNAPQLLMPTDANARKIELLEARLEALERRFQDSCFWQPVDHVALGQYNYLGNVLELLIPDNVVPAGASEVLVAVNWNTGHEGPSRFVDTEVWTRHIDGRKFSMYTSGYRYPQSALSYDTQCFWFPLRDTDRRLYVHSNDVQATNCHLLKLHIIGYRL